MNEESEEAGYPDDQNPPPSSDSIPAPEPASPNQDNIKEGEMELEELTGRVIGCAIAVHRELGPGFVETIYENALIVELRHMEIPFQAQGERPIFYRGEMVGLQRFDLLVAEQLVVELKTLKALEAIHFAQVRSYLKALRLNHGLLFNFASMPLTIKRVIYRGAESDPS